jgi:hypothetical protein
MLDSSKDMMATFMELCHLFVYPECWALAIDATVHRRRDPAQTTMAKFYSRFIISSAFWTFVEPVIATRAILALLRSFYGPNDLLYFGKLIHNWSRVLYPLSIVLNELVSSHLASLRRKREMGRLGCYDLIPRVKVCPQT